MTPSILITQCLQNDFVKLIGPHEPLPNKLHIGFDEVSRLIGERPEEGMLINFMDWAYRQSNDDLRIINIRDWHDKDIREQQRHLERFGDHCLKDTEGAEFVFEDLRKDEREFIVNASGLNDFVHTGLEEYLDQFKGQRIKVGVIGVWTEAKISYLCYDLVSRYPEFEIAVCSGLTASSSTQMHYVSLDQLKTILGVEVYSSPNEFAKFLHHPETTLGLKNLAVEEDATFQFEDETNLSEDDMELLRYLFRNSHSVKFKVLDGGFSGNVVMKAAAIDRLRHEELPTVVKIGPRNPIAHERDSFEKVQDVLGNSAPSIVAYLENEHRAGIKYRYASMFDEKVQTFQQFYAYSDSQEKIQEFLEVVFKKQLGRFYRASTLEQLDLLSYYDFSDKYADSVLKKVEDLIGGFSLDTEEIEVAGKFCYNLGRFYKKELADLSVKIPQSHYMSYIHGDLNGANIIIDARENVWLIDFFHTHRGHVLKDLIKLENDLCYIFMKINSEEEYLKATEFMDHVLDTEDLWAPLKDRDFGHPELNKAFATLRKLRSYYPELIQLDRSPYQLFVGLLRYSVHTLSFDECNFWQRMLALYSSCILAQKVKGHIDQTKQLRFDQIPIVGEGLAMTILPGRKDRERSLEIDVKAIQEAGFDKVLALVTHQELEEYGVPDLLSTYQSAGLDLLHVSIPDQGTSTREEMHRMVDWLHDSMSKGEKVLMHCVGGLGRTGSVAACFLKKYHKLQTKEAINLVREARSARAVETKNQEEFVEEFS